MRFYSGGVLLLLALPALLLVADSCSLLRRSAGPIAFASRQDGNQDIYVVAPDGTQLVRLTDNPADDYSPAWSPDHRRVAFVSRRDGHAEVYVSESDGQNLTRVTNSPANKAEPVWSPDGKRLAYLSDADGRQLVFVVDLAATGTYPLDLSPGTYLDAAWSPDGRWIAFALEGGNRGERGIFLRNPGGVNRIQLTDGEDRHPAWSPDSQALAFQSRRDGNWEIYVVRLAQLDVGTATGEVRRLTENPAADVEPTWSPNGQWIAFLSARDGNREVYVLRPDGTGLRRLTHNDVEERGLAWSTDNRLAFVSYQDSLPGLFTMMADGGEQTRVTPGQMTALEPAW